MPSRAASTIDPTQPLTGLPYTSAPIRNNFSAAVNDINALQNANIGAIQPFVCNLANGGRWWINNAASNWAYNQCDGPGGTWVTIFSLNTLTNTVTFPIASSSSVSSSSGQNVLINPAFHFDQINEGASYPVPSQAVPNVTRVVDGWIVGYTGSATGVTAQRSGLDVPPGFANALVITIGAGGGAPAATDNLAVFQNIEANLFAASAFGTATAQNWSAAIWVKSSISATFSLPLKNVGLARAYVSLCSVTGGVWTQCPITGAPGDTTGTWPTSGTAQTALFGIELMCGSSLIAPATNAWQSGNVSCGSSQTQITQSSGVTVKITGAQLSFSPTVPPFVYRNPADEISLLQRYYEKSWDIQNGATPVGAATLAGDAIGYLPVAITNGSNPLIYVPFKVTKRCDPVNTFYSPTTGQAGFVDIAGLPSAVLGSGPPVSSMTRIGGPTNNSGSTWAAGSTIAFQWTADCRL